MYTYIHIWLQCKSKVFHLEVGVASAMNLQVIPCTCVICICVLEYFCEYYK